MNSNEMACVPPLFKGNSRESTAELNTSGVEPEPIGVAGLSRNRTLREDPSDESLLHSISTGSKEALGCLFRRYRTAVLKIAGRILRDSSEAEDLCQEVFLLLFQKAKQFDPSRGRASSWIVQIAYCRAMNRRQYLAHRQHYNTQEFDETQIGAGRSPVFVDEITARDLLGRLRDQLSEQQRETLELHFFDGYSLGEIADRTHQTLGNVRNHFYRGLERLRSNLFPKKNV